MIYNLNVPLKPCLKGLLIPIRRDYTIFTSELSRQIIQWPSQLPIHANGLVSDSKPLHWNNIYNLKIEKQGVSSISTQKKWLSIQVNQQAEHSMDNSRNKTSCNEDDVKT
jgi:hypothetical protein